jgi:hypothetical protein
MQSHLGQVVTTGHEPDFTMVVTAEPPAMVVETAGQSLNLETTLPL